jgi:hypothetical protein
MFGVRFSVYDRPSVAPGGRVFYKYIPLLFNFPIDTCLRKVYHKSTGKEQTFPSLKKGLEVRNDERGNIIDEIREAWRVS